MLIRFICFYLILMHLVSCSTNPKKNSVILPAEETYLYGLKLLHNKKYKAAAEQFSNIYFQHPGSPITPHAELMEAYCLCLQGEYEEASDVLDNFIKLHPANEKITEAYYLKALVAYYQIFDIKHDKSKAEEAKLALEAVINRFPNSSHATDAQQKLAIVTEHLAGKEMDIGRFYLQNKNPIAALNRFDIVISDYHYTSYYPEALYRIAESYAMLGCKEEVKKYLTILEKKHPNSTWSKYKLSLQNL